MINDLLDSLAKASGLEKSALAQVLVRSHETSRGDFAFPCFTLAKEWKVSPPECAKKLKEKIILPKKFERAEAVGPYLNFFLDRAQFTKEVIPEILQKGYSVGKAKATNETIIVEYSSPNIAKNLHVGHMRTTLIGLSLERINKILGHNVISINHLGDWGVQFGYIWAGCELWGKPKEPSINALVELYVQASNLKKAQEENKVSPQDASKPNVSEMARNYFLRLEDGDKDALKFWEWCLELTLIEFKAIYKRLNIEFDHYTGESFYRDHIPAVEEMVRQSGILEESRGALGVDLGKELGFARIFAEDGRSLYITRDIAQAIYRDKTFNPKKILYVVAAQQALHFKQFIEIMSRMKHPVSEKMVHVSFGFVPGMKTREGSAILLKDFLEEAHTRALSAYREEVTKRPEGLDEENVAESVAIGATYFYFLKHTNIKDFNFSWTEALNFHGDSGAYVQYALARLYSMETKAKENGMDISPSTLANLSPEALKENEAHELVSLLSRYSEIIEKAGNDCEPSHVALYALDLAKAVAKAYKNLRVIGEESTIAQARLALFVASKFVLHSALTLVGVPAVERM